MLGRLFPEYFPKIFGKNENEPLDFVASEQKFQELAKQINAYFHETDASKQPMSIQEIAMGFIRVANEAMCRYFAILS